MTDFQQLDRSLVALKVEIRRGRIVYERLYTPQGSVSYDKRVLWNILRKIEDEAHAAKEALGYRHIEAVPPTEIEEVEDGQA